MSARSISIQGLYGIADAGFRPDLPLEAKVRAFLEGGACAVQLRLKGRPARELLDAARRARELARGRALVLVNDRPDVALAAGVDGVHVGDEDLPVAEVRRLVGPAMVVGATARSLAQARQALRDGADYIGFGPIWATATKPVAAEARGLEQLSSVARALDAPVVAIGGLTVERAAEVARAGASAGAVISDVLGAADPAERARRFARAFQEGRSAP
jgi:thiamine-phosphate pyrophosphorylase